MHRHSVHLRRVQPHSPAAPTLVPRPRQRAGTSCTAAAVASGVQIIDGKKIAEDIRGEIASEVAKIKAASGQVPGLAVVLVGARKDSETYVRSKKKACAEVRSTVASSRFPGQDKLSLR